MSKILSFFFSIAIVAVCKASNIKDDIFLQDNYIRNIMLKTATWQLSHPKHNQNDWTNGAFYAGLFAAWKTTKSEILKSAIQSMATDSNQWRPGNRWYHADDHVICQTYIDLYKVDNYNDISLLKPTTDTITKFIDNQYPVKGIEVIKWWWCDALFMGPPVLIKLANITGNMRLIDSVYIYYKQCYDLLYNKDECLFARDLGYVIKGNDNDRYEKNGKCIFWSRGNGWVLGGLVRILEELPDDYALRPFYAKIFMDMCSKIIKLQQPDGLWRASLLDPDSYPGGEVSGSGFFCYALAWGINNGLLKGKQFKTAAINAWKALNKCINTEGRVGWVQPIGADPKLNFNADSWEVYGTGAFLLAGSEIIKLVSDFSSEVILLADGFAFTEGPTADKDGNVYFTDQPNDKIYKWSVDESKLSVFSNNTGRANGLYFVKKGTLLSCSDKDNELWEWDKQGSHKVLLTEFEGKKLNGPNDLWEHPKKGGIYFTDPLYQRDYWIRNPDMQQDGQHVYYITPDYKRVIKVATDLKQPNGIIGTPDGNHLYIADIGDGKTYVYDINKDGTLSNKTLFCEMGSDGMTIDKKGNIYLTGKGVTVFNPKGEKIAHIDVNANWTANVCFGGKKKNILFITASEGFYSVKINN